MSWKWTSLPLNSLWRLVLVWNECASNLWKKKTNSVVFLRQMKLLDQKFSEEVQCHGTWSLHENQTFTHFFPSLLSILLNCLPDLKLLHIYPSSCYLRTNGYPFFPPGYCKNKLFYIIINHEFADCTQRVLVLWFQGLVKFSFSRNCMNGRHISQFSRV